jgi:hypothetical protein
MAPAQQRTTCTLRSPDRDLDVPTPSTPHSILSPADNSAAMSAGVPVMMMSPTQSETLLGQFGNDLRHAPDQLREGALLPLADAGIIATSLLRAGAGSPPPRVAAKARRTRVRGLAVETGA